MLALLLSKSNKNWVGPVGYLSLIFIGIGLVLVTRSIGEGFLVAPPLPVVSADVVGLPKPKQVDVVFHVTATLAAVIFCGFVVGQIFRALGQPPVIGEVLAGIALGPSLLGAISPEAMHFLIPSREGDPNGQVTAALKAISQLGVTLYMFLVGLELSPNHLQKHARSAVVISHTGIVVPFVLGGLLSLGLYPIFSNDSVPFTSFSLFMGVALAITAFPVLARILSDQKLDRSELGIMALSCAASDDITAWCLLALVIGVSKAQVAGALMIITAAVAFMLFMFFVARPALAWLMRKWDQQEGPLPPFAIPGAFLFLLLSALITESIGIHVIIGAFLFGAVIPNDCRLARELPDKLKEPVHILLLPAFFAYTGMRTQISLVSGWENWLWCAVIILVATLGKFGGATIAARLTGQSWSTAAGLGVLMNTRGLMELIVLNIGLDLGVISPTIFAMMVLMALTTTIATAPLLSLIPLKTEPRPAV